MTIAAFLFVMAMLVRHTCATLAENGHRSIVEHITRALTQRDLSPVLALFPDAAAVSLTQDLRLGAIADRLNSLGDLREVRYVDHGELPDTQIFVATFAHGTVREQVAFQNDRVIGFTLLPR